MQCYNTQHASIANHYGRACQQMNNKYCRSCHYCKPPANGSSKRKGLFVLLFCLGREYRTVLARCCYSGGVLGSATPQHALSNAALHSTRLQPYRLTTSSCRIPCSMRGERFLLQGCDSLSFHAIHFAARQPHWTPVSGCRNVTHDLNHCSTCPGKWLHASHRHRNCPLTPTACCTALHQRPFATEAATSDEQPLSHAAMRVLHSAKCSTAQIDGAANG